jgi:hypothetical protein
MILLACSNVHALDVESMGGILKSKRLVFRMTKTTLARVAGEDKT